MSSPGSHPVDGQDDQKEGTTPSPDGAMPPPLSPPSPAMSAASSSSTPSLSPSVSPLTSNIPSFIQPTMPPLLASILWKKGSTFGGWSKRFYRLHPEMSRLYYSKDDSPDSPIRGEILLTRFSCCMLRVGPKEKEFRIDVPNRVHILRAEDAETARAWMEALESIQRTHRNRSDTLITEETRQASESGSLQKAAADHCAACKEPFGLLRRNRVVCARCGFWFCGSLTCVQGRSLASKDRYCLACAERRGSKAVVTANAQSDGKGHRKSTSSSTLFLTTQPSSSAPSSSTSPSKLKLANANLLVRVNAGRHLMVCDSNRSSDPYVVLFFDGHEYKTEVQWATLNPQWNEQFVLPVTGASKELFVGVYDSDRYSNDDFMGMVHIPLAELERDRVFEDWFPLKARPGKKSDKDLPISGAIHMQIVLTESLFSLFAPIWDNQLEPEEKYSQAVLKHNVKRLQMIAQSINIGWWQVTADEIFTYKSPMKSIIVLLVYWCLVLFFPSDWLLPSIPLLLLLLMTSNYVRHQSRILRNLEHAAAYRTRVMRAKDGSQLLAADEVEREKAEELNALAIANGHMNHGPDGRVKDDWLDDEGEEEDDDDEDDDEQRMTLGFISKLRRFQKQLAKVQNVMGGVCNKLEAIQNLFRWRDERKSKIVAVILLLAFLFLLLVPFRALLFVAGTAKWAKHLLQSRKKRKESLRQQKQEAEGMGMDTDDKKGKKPSIVDNFLARTPNDTTFNPLLMHIIPKLRKG